MVLLGYFHIFVVFRFKGHLKMLAANHSTYLWHDFKILQDWKAGERVGAECHESGKDRGMLMPLGEGSGVRGIPILWFSFPFGGVCEISSLPHSLTAPAPKTIAATTPLT